MAMRSGEQGEQSADYQWLLREASRAEFWFAVDMVVDWLEKQEQIKNLRSENGVDQAADGRAVSWRDFLLI